MDINNIKQKIWENRLIIFALIIIFFLAISIRSDIVRFEGNYLFEPDAYYHARLVQHLAVDGYIPQIDPNVYYQVEGGMGHTSIEFQHITIYFIYLILSLGFYSKEALALAVQIAPIFFGSIISVSMYFLAKEIFNDKRIGLITAFLAAITPAFAYRTMAGAEGNDSLGFVWMVIGFVFLIRAIKNNDLNKKELLNATLAGIFFGLMGITWRANILIPLVLIPAAILMLIFISGNSNSKKELIKSEPFNFIVKIGISLGIYTIISTIYGLFSDGYADAWFLSLTRSISGVLKVSPEIILVLGIIVTIAFVAACFFIYYSKKDIKELTPTIVISVLYLGLLFTGFVFLVEDDLFYRGDGRQSIASLVGEESIGNQFFGTKYNSLIILPIIALIFFPISLHFFKRKDSHTQILLWFWALITLAMAWYKLKFTFIFGLGLVAGAAITCYLIFELIRKYNLNKGIEGKTTIIAFGFLLMIGIGGSDLYLTQFSPFANSSPYWIETMDWIQENTASDAKFFNWWGDGHQLAFVTERKFSSDNRNASNEANALYAEFNITTSVERGYQIVKEEIGAEYIILPSSNFFSGPTYEFYFNNSVDSRLGAKYGDFQSRVIDCSTGLLGINCGGQTIPTEQYSAFGSEWKNTPSDFFNGQVPIFYYAGKDQLIILGPTYNQTNLAKVYFNSSETQNYYEEVFSLRGMKIFKVK